MRTSVLVLLACSAMCQVASAADRKVLIVGIDGVRPDAFQVADTPNMDALIANGAVSWTCMAEDISFSGPCWSTILTGVHRAKHGVTSNSFVPNNFSAYPHFFARLRGAEGACPGIRTASIVHWAPVNTNIVMGNADVIQTYTTDDAVRDAVAAEVSQGTTDVVYLHLDDVDHAGHAYGFSPTVPQYVQAIEQEDARVGVIMNAIESRPSYANEDWLVIIVSDHGGSGTSHGANTLEHRTTIFAVTGASTQIGTTFTNTTLADVVPTVLTFLGIAIDPAWGLDGNVVGLNMGGATSDPFNCTARRMLLSEDFESVPLGNSVHEAAATRVWSGSPPIGWTFDDSGVPGLNDPNIGVTEWEGWAITSKDWWVSIAGDQNRSQFTSGVGAVMVADCDEHDDRGGPSAIGPYNAHAISPAVSLAGVEPETVQVAFDSSWRYEGIQRALLTVRYDGGAPVTLLDWRSAAGANFKPDATNEAVRINAHNPVGASSMVLDFALLDGRNNWWWAVDNLVIDGKDAPCPACAADYDANGGVDGGDLAAFFGDFEAGSRCADVDGNGGVDGGDLGYFFLVFEAGGC